MLYDSLAMDVYAVNVDEMRKLVGCKDSNLVAAAKTRLRRPPWSEYSYPYPSNPLGPGLEQLVMKKHAPGTVDAKYVGHAFRLLTAMHGTSLPVSAWNLFDKQGMTDVDKGLRKLGLGLGLTAQFKAAPVKLPTDREAPMIGHASASDVASSASALADAVKTAKTAAAPVEQCTLTKRKATWVGSIVGTDVVQLWRSSSGKERRQVSPFMHLDGARRTYEAYIRDREAEGYTLVSRTEAPKGGGAKRTVELDGKVLARIEEASTWYTAAAKKNLGLIFFIF